jgi:hypothetical protein
MKNLTFPYLAGIVLFAFLTSACSKDENDSIDIERGFSITVPSDWSEEYDVDNTIIYEAISPEEDLTDIFYENVNIIRSQITGESLMSIYKINKNYIEEEFINPVFEKEELTAINGMDAQRVLYRAQIENVPGIEFMFDQYFFYEEEVLYVVTFTSTSGSYEDWQYIFNEIIDSFMIL